MELERIGDTSFNKGYCETAIANNASALTLESSSFASNSLDMAPLNVKLWDCWYKIEQYKKTMAQYANAQLRDDDITHR